MAAGRPAVVTPAAAAGIDHGDPPPFLIAGSPDEFATAVVRLLRDASCATALARAARALAEEKYDAADQARLIEQHLSGEIASPPKTCGRRELGHTPVLVSGGAVP
jgi:polysaccharide biosynthesis protein PslH